MYHLVLPRRLARYKLFNSLCLRTLSDLLLLFSARSRPFIGTRTVTCGHLVVQQSHGRLLLPRLQGKLLPRRVHKLLVIALGYLAALRWHVIEIERRHLRYNTSFP